MSKTIDEKNKLRYVVGFITYKDEVILIKKIKPHCFKGLLNGVGGLAKEWETNKQAIIRKTLEETDLEIKKWNPVASRRYIKNEKIIEVYFFHAEAKEFQFSEYESMTDETLDTYKIYDLPENTVEDVPYFLDLISLFRNPIYSKPEGKKND